MNKAVSPIDVMTIAATVGPQTSDPPGQCDSAGVNRASATDCNPIALATRAAVGGVGANENKLFLGRESGWMRLWHFHSGARPHFVFFVFKDTTVFLNRRSETGKHGSTIRGTARASGCVDVVVSVRATVCLSTGTDD